VLYDNIKDKSRVLLNKRVERIEHAEDGVTVHCCVGASHAGDIVVGADGVFSKVRQEMWRLADKIEPTNFSHADKISECHRTAVTGPSILTRFLPQI